MIEDPILRIESFAITNLRGVSTKLYFYLADEFSMFELWTKICPSGLGA